MSLKLLLLSVGFGIYYGVILTVCWACFRGTGLISRVLRVVLPLGLLVCSQFDFAWFPAPGRMARATGLVNDVSSTIMLLVTVIAVTIASTLLFRRLGLADKIARRLSSWGAAIAVDRRTKDEIDA